MNTQTMTEIERRRQMFHWYINGWGYHVTPDFKFSMFPKHGIPWELYDKLTPDWVTEHYNIEL